MLKASKNFTIHFLPRLLRQSLALGCLMLFPFAPPIFAQDAETATAGAGLGSFFPKDYKLDCGTKALIGVKGKAGKYIDSIQGLCVEINNDGSWRGSPTATSTTGGPEGNTPFELKCPAGQAVSAISGRAGSFVDQLKIHCSRLDGQGHTTGAASELAGFSAGDTGGTSFGPLNCPANKPAKALKGKSGQFIDSIGLACNFPIVSAPPGGSSLISRMRPTIVDKKDLDGATQLTPVNTPLPDLKIKIEELPSQIREDNNFSFYVRITVTGAATPQGKRFKIYNIFEGAGGRLQPQTFEVWPNNAGCNTNLTGPQGSVGWECTFSGNNFYPEYDRFYPHESINIKITVYADLPGTYTFKTTVDSTSLITESNENNNTAQHTVTVVR